MWKKKEEGYGLKKAYRFHSTKKTQREKLTVQQKLEQDTILKQGNSKKYTEERSLVDEKLN